MNKMSTSPRIAIISKHTVLNWEFHVDDAFRALGCETLILHSNWLSLSVKAMRGILKAAVGRDVAREKTDSILAEIMARRLRKFKPDMVFFAGCFFITPTIVQMAASLSPRPIVVGWDGDNHILYPGAMRYRDFIDILFESDLSSVRANPNDFRRMEYLPFAANPVRHRLLSSPSAISLLKSERKAALYFCGVRTDERERAFAPLLDLPMTVRGPQWRTATRGKHWDMQSGRIPLEKQMRDYNQHLAVINTHQAAHNSLSCLNMRSFEPQSCGALLICDNREELPMMFEFGKEILVYNSDNELAEFARRILSDLPFAAKIADAGHKRILSEHTYTHRMRRVLDIAGFNPPTR